MNYENFDPYSDKTAVALIKYRIKALIDNYGYPIHMKEDLFQEMAMVLWQKMPEYNPKRAKPVTFMRFLLDLEVQKRIQSKKGDHSWYTADPTADAGKSGYAAYDARRTQHMASEPTTQDMSQALPVTMTFRQVYEDLDPKLKKVFYLMVKHGSIKQAAAASGHAESTVANRLVQLRRIFEDAGLGVPSARFGPQAKAGGRRTGLPSPAPNGGQCRRQTPLKWMTAFWRWVVIRLGGLLGGPQKQWLSKQRNNCCEADR